MSTSHETGNDKVVPDGEDHTHTTGGIDSKQTLALARTLHGTEHAWCDAYEQMICGLDYDGFDPMLVAARFRARRLMASYADPAVLQSYHTIDEISQHREELLFQLLGRVGKKVFIEPPLSVDYGSNIIIGDEVFMNFKYAFSLHYVFVQYRSLRSFASQHDDIGLCAGDDRCPDALWAECILAHRRTRYVGAVSQTGSRICKADYDWDGLLDWRWSDRDRRGIDRERVYDWCGIGRQS